MSEKDPKDILARKNQQQGTLGTNRARMCSRRDRQAQMELDRPNFAEANIWHNQAGPRVEPARQKEGGKASENLEEVIRRGAQTSQHHLECCKKNSRKQSPLAQYSVRPLFHEEPNGQTTTTTTSRWPNVCCCYAIKHVHKDFKKQRCLQENDHFIYSTPALSVLFFSIIESSVLSLRRQLDVSKLKCLEISRQFTIELRNRFAVLADAGDDCSVETEWRDIKHIYVETATDILGYKKKGNKEWLTPGTWQRIKERKVLKAKMLNTRSPRLRGTGPNRVQDQRLRGTEKCTER